MPIQQTADNDWEHRFTMLVSSRRQNMTESLRRVVSEIEGLPDEEQDRIANLLQAELDRRWEDLLESPASLRMLDELAERVRDDRRAGRTKEFPS
jgi:hypothetical protein